LGENSLVELGGRNRIHFGLVAGNRMRGCFVGVGGSCCLWGCRRWRGLGRGGIGCSVVVVVVGDGDVVLGGRMRVVGSMLREGGAGVWCRLGWRFVAGCMRRGAGIRRRGWMFGSWRRGWEVVGRKHGYGRCSCSVVSCTGYWALGCLVEACDGSAVRRLVQRIGMTGYMSRGV